MSDEAKKNAGGSDSLDELVGCPFCGASAEHIGGGDFSVSHKDDCWILGSGFHCNYGVQFISSKAEKETWAKRASNDTYQSEETEEV